MATWNIDTKHSTVEFVVTHMMFSKVRGNFSTFEGQINFDPVQANDSSVEVVIDVASVNTGVGDRDGHLKSADFFDVENYPQMTFKSTKVEANGESAKITGDLTIRGVTKTVVLDAQLLGQGKNPLGMTVAGFNASTKINREEFGLVWNQVLEAGGVLVSKDITIELNIQAALAG
jgi:polyisoprenoid-binding protein YceI